VSPTEQARAATKRAHSELQLPLDIFQALFYCSLGVYVLRKIFEVITRGDAGITIIALAGFILVISFWLGWSLISLLSMMMVQYDILAFGAEVGRSRKVLAWTRALLAGALIALLIVAVQTNARVLFEAV
jgi:hypothetical protein